MNLHVEGRILYVATPDISVSDGPGVNEREFVYALQAALGERAHFVVPQPAHSLDRIDLSGLTFARPQRYSLGTHWRAQISLARTAERVLRQRRFDLIVHRLGPLPIAAAYLADRTGLPFAIKTLGAGVFDVFGSRSGVAGSAFRAISPVNDRIFRNLIQRSAAIDACTPELVGWLASRFNIDLDRIRCVPNAINARRFGTIARETARRKLGLSAFDPIIGFVGGRVSERGGAQVIETAFRLRDDQPRIGAVVVGGGADLGVLRTRATKLGLLDRCVFTGLVPFEQVPAYLSAFDVCFSFDRAERAALIGNSSQKVRQYVAAGKPVVAGPGGNGFLITHMLGSIVDADSLDGICEATRRWLALDDSARNAHHDRATAYARTHLSIEHALGERLQFWGERLGAGLSVRNSYAQSTTGRTPPP